MAKRVSKTRRPVPPKVNLLLACDAISRDPNTGKVSLYGIFDGISVATFPATAKFALFAKISGTGRVPMTIRLIRPRGRPQTLGEFDINFKRERTAELTLDLAPLVFKHSGEYKVSLDSHGKAIGKPLSLPVKRRPKN